MMKLLFCTTCDMVFRLTSTGQDCPGCGRCGGRYTDGLNAIWWGDAVPLGFQNSSLVTAIATQPEQKPGRLFRAFVIEKNCPTFKHVPGGSHTNCGDTPARRILQDQEIIVKRMQTALDR